MIIYIKTLILFGILFLTGISLIKRAFSVKRAEIILPVGGIFGIALFLFLVNLFAYLIKGQPLFYVALIVQIVLTFIIAKVINTPLLEFPKEKNKIIWVASLFFWGIFFLIITHTSPFDGSDNTFYYSQASVFSRGDFPIHTPWQPDYVSYSHLGISQLLGAVRSLTGAPYHFIHALLAFITLFCSIQILIWILIPKMSEKFSDIFLFSLPSLIGFISLGAFMIVWPNKLAFPNIDNGILNWLNKLPTIEVSNALAGFLDPLIYILHRLVSTSFVFGILTILLYPLKINYFTFFVIIIFSASIALLDESVLISTLPAIFLVSFLSFNKKIKIWIIFVLVSLFIIASQGGIITESIINRYGSGSGILIFPSDNPDNPYQNFRSFRLHLQSSTLFENLPKFQPFRWFQIGIIWQLLIFLTITIFYIRKRRGSEYWQFNNILIFTFISSLSALIAFHGLVPKLFHTNGWRFLALSYQFSGIGIGFFLIDFFKLNKNILFKILIIWILITSLIPPFARLFPRRDDLYWFKLQPEVKRASFTWVKENLPIEKRILALTDSGVVPSSSMDLTTQIGVFTPIWAPEIRAYENYDTSPAFADLYYTLNPKLLKKLKVDYLIINNIYASKLPEQRKKELLNYSYFQTVYSDPSEIIIKVMPAYLKQANDIVTGTLEELDKIAPLDGSIYIDHESIGFYRAVVMTLRERRIYGEHDYWSRIEGKIPIFGKLDHYDYLIIGENANPKTICHCDAILLWSGFGNIKVWKTN